MPYLFSPGVHKGIQEVQLNEEGCSQAVLLLQSNHRGSQEKGRSGKNPLFLNSGNKGFDENHNLTIWQFDNLTICQAKKNAEAVKKAKEKSAKLAASSRFQKAFQFSSSLNCPQAKQRDLHSGLLCRCDQNQHRAFQGGGQGEDEHQGGGSWQGHCRHPGLRHLLRLGEEQPQGTSHSAWCHCCGNRGICHRTKRGD